MSSLICANSAMSKFNSRPTSTACKTYFSQRLQTYSRCFSEILQTYNAISLLISIIQTRKVIQPRLAIRITHLEAQRPRSWFNKDWTKHSGEKKIKSSEKPPHKAELANTLVVLTQPVVSEFGCQFSKRPYRPNLCFTPFSYNASSKFTPLVNFYSLSFGLRPLAACILLRYGNIIFYFRLFIYARFLRKATRA